MNPILFSKSRAKRARGESAFRFALKPQSCNHLTRVVIVLLLLFLITPFVSAQQVSSTPQPCNLSIVSNFESQCILPEDKDNYYNEEPETIIACQGSVVTYTASANTGMATVTGWTWEVAGGTLSSSGNTAIVTWGNGNQGQITVTVVTDSGTTCTITQNVRLIEKPTIYVVTTPAYVEMPNGDKVINVCKGETVEFTDLSSTTNTDIVGYYWESGFYGLTASTQNFRIENVWHDDEVIHRVYNNCGCYDEEHYIIKVLEKEILELSCYGTVCQDAEVTYTAINPPCEQYSWYVEGGTIIDGQDQPQVTVRWDNPQNGYGIIGLDGNLCGGDACPLMLSKKIPIIEKDITIKGQDIVCEKEAVIYSVPLYGSTEYHWNIQPATGISVFEVNEANQKMIEFEHAGTYQITVSYKCDFLECGEFTSKPLTVVVKPRLAITGENRICISNPCNLSTSPTITADWTVYYMDNNNQFITEVSSVSTMNTTFQQPGKYLIIAHNANYCRDAEFILTVQNAPQPPTILDLNPSNPTSACPYDGVRLQAHPQNPNYTIVWQPSCASASPSQISGNDITINYGATVCNIEAYTFDRTLNCMSTTPFIQQINKLEPVQLDTTKHIFTCPGTIISWDNNDVPYQEGILYEWTIQEDMQHCASIQGSSMENSIDLTVHEQASGVYGYYFYIVLKRTACHEDYFDTFYIHVKDHTPTNLSLSANPQSNCPGEQFTFTGTGGIPSDYRWKVDGHLVSFIGNPYTCSFSTPGVHNVTVLYNETDGCTNLEYFDYATTSVVVYPAPIIYGIDYDVSTQTVCVDVAPGSYSYQWYYNGSLLSGEISSCTQVLGYGSYMCEVTNGSQCKSSESKYIGPTTPGNVCNVIANMAGVYDFCSARLSLTSPIATSPYIYWSCSGTSNQRTINVNPNDRHYATIQFNDVGYYYLKSYTTGNNCEISKYTQKVSFIPDFTFEKQCNKIVIHNNSKSLTGTEHISFTVTGHSPCDFDFSEKTYDYTVSTNGTYAFTLNITVDGQPYTCTYPPVIFNTINNSTVSISSSNSWNQHQTCNNTPIEFTASCNTISPITSTHWQFSDGTFITVNGNKINHTFSNNYGVSNYTVIATVDDANGCPINSMPFNIVSYPNNLNPYSLDPVGNMVCPNTARYIIFQQWGTPPPYCYYYWNGSMSSSYDYQYATFVTGDYSTIAINNYFCHAQDMINVKFKNKPTAVIVTEKEDFCTGETVILYGATGPDSNDYTYLWRVKNINNGIIYQYTTATAFFNPPNNGNYEISLEITSISSDCFDTATHKIIKVHPTPPAPSITFGSNSCIDNPPVILSGSSSATSQINWSNGDVGSTAYYFTPGMATAWYYDPNTGCKSEEAHLHIEPQPDFDALLTGCYKKCRGYFETNPKLPVWGLTSGREDIIWKWLFNTNNIANGTVCYPDYSLSLPLQGFGDYNLHLDYHNGICGTLISPTLTIEPKDTCDCINLDVSYKYEMRVEDCKIYYDVDVTVCNNSNNTDCLRALEYLFNEEYIRVVYTDFTNTSIAPNDCYTFHLKIEALQFVPSSTISFRLFDECNNCTTNFSINLMPEKFDCEMEMQLVSFDINPEWSSNVAAYFDFKFDVSPCQSLIAFWSEPPMVINYWYDGAAIVQGLGMVSYATLTQMIAEGGKVCFYAITCEGDQLCRRMYCIPAEEILHILQEMGIEPRQSSDATSDNDGNGTKQSKSQELGNDTTPQLMPNPTTGEVNVIGTSDEVVEVLVMDMNGRKMATFENSANFNISTLPSGIYIVRVKTHLDNTDKVTYLKLVKK